MESLLELFRKPAIVGSIVKEIHDVWNTWCGRM